MIWVDHRLNFKNLVENDYQNEIPHEVAEQIWKPYLVFENHKETTKTKQLLMYTQFSTEMMIQRNGNGTEAPLTHPNEARVYNSSITKILMRTNHFLTFTCDFDLHYFPFDSQECLVQVTFGSVMS